VVLKAVEANNYIPRSYCVAGIVQVFQFDEAIDGTTDVDHGSRAGLTSEGSQCVAGKSAPPGKPVKGGGRRRASFEETDKSEEKPMKERRESGSSEPGLLGTACTLYFDRLVALCNL
jgi:hypothetical protein